MKRNFVLGIIAMLSIIFCSCNDTETRTQPYVIVEVTGNVRDAYGAALVNTSITGRISTAMDKSFVAATKASGEYTLRFEIVQEKDKETKDFLLSLEAMANLERYETETIILQVKAEDFSGYNKKDEYYRGTASFTQNFVLKINNLN